jgi:hypothetical protein
MPAALFLCIVGFTVIGLVIKFGGVSFRECVHLLLRCVAISVTSHPVQEKKVGVPMMQTVFRTGKLVVGILAFVLMISDQAAADLVTNGSFETGNFSGWSQSGDPGFTGVASAGFFNYAAQDGSHFAALGPFTSGDLSQSLATTAGASYTFTWYLASDGVSPNGFQAFWNGSSISNQTNLPTTHGNYTGYSFTEVATSSHTTIQFGFYDPNSYLALDNVSVVANAVAAPEPSTAIVGVVGGLAMTGYVCRSRRRRARAAA